jgi:hypothetical protein
MAATPTNVLNVILNKLNLIEAEDLRLLCTGMVLLMDDSQAERIRVFMSGVMDRAGSRGGPENPGIPPECEYLERVCDDVLKRVSKLDSRSPYNMGLSDGVECVRRLSRQRSMGVDENPLPPGDPDFGADEFPPAMVRRDDGTASGVLVLRIQATGNGEGLIAVETGKGSGTVSAKQVFKLDYDLAARIAAELRNKYTSSGERALQETVINNLWAQAKPYLASED